MRVPIALLVLLLTISGSGCLLQEATDVLVCRTIGSLEDCAERKRNWKWAEGVWKDICQTSGQSFSKDYALGFKTGFANFLYEGGSGEPPLLPPPRYRKLRSRTAEGYAAAEDWFRGFRHGVAVARDGDYRRWVLGPTSLPVCDDLPSSALPRVEPMPPATEEPIMVVPIRVRPAKKSQQLPEPEQVRRSDVAPAEAHVPANAAACDTAAYWRTRACQILSQDLLGEAVPDEEPTPKESR
jgi:hypothetical protein